MQKTFSIGQRVTLTESIRRAVTEPEKYRSGTVTRVGAWNIVYVRWNGFDYDVGMRGDELEGINNG